MSDSDSESDSTHSSNSSVEELLVKPLEFSSQIKPMLYVVGTRQICAVCHGDSLKAGKASSLQSGVGIWNGGSQSTNQKNHFSTKHASITYHSRDTIKHYHDLVAKCSKSKVQTTLDVPLEEQWCFLPGKPLPLNDEQRFIFFMVDNNTSLDKASKPSFKFGYRGKIPAGCTDPRSIKKLMDSTNLHIRNHLLASFGGENVCITADKGRVWNDYIPIIIVNTRTGASLLFELVHVGKDGDINDSCADNLVKLCKRIIDTLAVRSITVVGICTDNAANMVKFRNIIATETKCIALGCMCHGIQLTVDDIVKGVPLWTTLVTRASALRAYFNIKLPGRYRPLPEANDTRWNSRYRLIKALLVHYENISDQLGADMSDDLQFSDDDLEFLESMCESLEPFYIATKVCESDKSSIYHSVAALQLLFNAPPLPGENERRIKDAVASRCLKKFILSDAAAVFLFFFPIFKRKVLRNEARPDNAAAQGLPADFTDLKSYLVTYLTKTEVLAAFGLNAGHRDALKNEIDSYLTKRDPYIVEKDDAETYTVRKALEFFETNKSMAELPLLRSILLAMGNLLVNEASAERLFSVLAQIIRKNSLRSSPKYVFDRLSIKLAINASQTLNSEKARLELLKSALDGTSAREVFNDENCNQEDAAAQVDAEPAEETDNILNTVVITHEMCLFCLEQCLLSYRQQAGRAEITCSLCKKQKLPQKMARDCLKKGAAAGQQYKMFQCIKCMEWFGIDHYNEQNELEEGDDDFVEGNDGETECKSCFFGRDALGRRTRE